MQADSLRSSIAPVVLVSGASSGLGRTVAQHLAACGFTTYAGARSFAGGATAPTGCKAVALDVTDDAAVSAAVEEIIAAEGRIDALVNCAAFFTLGSCEEVSAAELQAVLHTNFLGMARMTRAVLPQMRSQGAGRIINFSSINGLLGIPFQSAYVASKHAIEGWSESLSQEVRRFGVRITVIEPGDCRGSSDKYRMRAKAAGTADSPYNRYFEGAVEKIAHDEGIGMPPERIARAVAKLLLQNNPPARKIVARPDQRLAVFLHTLLPGKLFYKIMEAYYAPAKEKR